MIHTLLTKVRDKHQRTGNHPEFRPGDTIRVHVKIKEGDKERLQAFEGTVIARNNTGMSETITVRKVSFGQGVERIFPLHAPVVDHIDIVRTGRVRRAKLYYLRGLKGQKPPAYGSATWFSCRVACPPAVTSEPSAARAFCAIAGVDEAGRGALFRPGFRRRGGARSIRNGPSEGSTIASCSSRSAAKCWRLASRNARWPGPWAQPTPSRSTA